MVYAVKVGRQTGKFSTWEECLRQVKGYSGAEYKKFKTDAEAEAYLQGCVFTSTKQASCANNAPKRSGLQSAFLKHLLPKADADANANEVITEAPETTKEAQEPSYMSICKTLEEGEAIAYVDGSYQEDTYTFGYGCILYTHDGEQTFSGCSSERRFAETRNITGECLGAIMALKEAIKAGCSKLTIYHDYTGIGKWGTGAWTARSMIAVLYVAYLARVRRYMTVEFKWVRGHSDDIHNIRADRLASKAISENKEFDVFKFFKDAELDTAVDTLSG